jgi:hypothetical protein
MYVLFLDDEKMPNDITWAEFPRYETIYIIRTYQGFVKQVETYGVPMFVCFDHDLTEQHYIAMLNETQNKPFNYGKEKTGLDCAKWLVQYCQKKGTKFPRYVVHSLNPNGKKRIEDFIESAKVDLDI